MAHPKIISFLKQIPQSVHLRAVSVVEQRELFPIPAQIDQTSKLITKGNQLLQDAEIAVDDKKDLQLISDAMAYQSKLAQNFQAGQLQNTVNLFKDDVNGVKEVAALKTLLGNAEYKSHAKALLLAIYNLHGIILTAQDKKTESLEIFKEALTHADPDAIEAGLLKINATNNLDDKQPEQKTQKLQWIEQAVAIAKAIQGSMEQRSHHQHALASLYLKAALCLPHSELANYEKAHELWPNSSIICNNFGIFLSDGDSKLDDYKGDPRQITHLTRALGLFEKAMNNDPENRTLVAPTYAAVASFKLAVCTHALSQRSMMYAEAMVQNCISIIENDDKAAKPGYNPEYKAAKRARYEEINQALVTVPRPQLTVSYQHKQEASASDDPFKKLRETVKEQLEEASKMREWYSIRCS